MSSAKISVLFGEPVSDNAIHRAVPLPAGVYAMGTPTITGTGPWTVKLTPGGDQNALVWRTIGDKNQGRHTIQEDVATPVAGLTIAVPDATNPRIDLIVGCHQWIDGAAIPGCMTSGQPNGTMDASMFPYYLVVPGTPAASPVAPTPAASYSGPNGTGGAPVVLAQVYVPKTGGGTPTVTPWPSTDLRWSTIYGRLMAPQIPAAGLPWVDTATGHVWTLTMTNGVLTVTY